MTFVTTDQTDYKKLFVKNLPRQVRWKELREQFWQFWELVWAWVVLDKETKRSKWFGFVEFADEESAKSALEQTNGQDFLWRPLEVTYAFIRTEWGE
jgi:cold-inducible RNA-binding protein